jgi:hypothetical protein
VQSSLDQAHTQWLFEHVWPLAQVPQLIELLQPSVAMPQLKPCASHVVGVHVHVQQ